MMKGTLSLILGLAGLLALTGAARAAPQVLAVLAPPEGVALACDRAGCRAELTTYCLQRHRDAPKDGQAYRAADPGDFALVVTDASGAERRIPAAGHLDFAADRGFMSVTATLRPESAAALGLVTGRLVAHERAALVPVADPRDGNPLTGEEIAAATGTLRTMGQGMVDGSASVSAALVLAEAKRRLQPGDDGNPDAYARLWQEAESALAGSLAHPGGIVRARVGFEQCSDALVSSGHGGMRRCLEWQHDHLIREVNKPFWDAQAGS